MMGSVASYAVHSCCCLLDDLQSKKVVKYRGLRRRPYLIAQEQILLPHNNYPKLSHGSGYSQREKSSNQNDFMIKRFDDCTKME